jgi:iron complex transport system ATP-binding protein
MLKADQITLSRGGRPLLRAVSLALRPGEVLAVLGPNGAGKSTLLKALCGLWEPDAGQILLNGRPLPGWSLEQRALRRAVVSQHTSLTFDFRVEEVAAMGMLGPARALEPVLDRALEAVHLAPKRRQSYLTLSGGERQRVHLARALVQLWGVELEEPRYLLLDEPTASLDPARALEVMALVRRLAAQGLGVLVVLHDLNLASQWADRLALMRQAEILAVGAPDQVMQPHWLGRAFDVPVSVVPHPDSGRPMLLPPTMGG